MTRLNSGLLCKVGVHALTYYRETPYDMRRCVRCGRVQRHASQLVDMGRDKIFWWETVPDESE